MNKSVTTAFSIFVLAGLLSIAPLQASEDSHNMEGMDHSQMGEGMDHGSMGESEIGKSGKGLAPTKTIKVTMLDTMRFEFDQTPTLKAGDVVKFVVTNNGKIPHEFSIGTPQEQQHHREMMKDMPNMDHGDSDNALTVQPGQTAPLLWQFSGKDQVLFACNVPGHFEAGMKHLTQLQ